jgi:hypothetical protein
MVVLSCLWLVVLYFFPKRWTALVEKENAFWVGTGMISAGLAEQSKRLETGIWAKLMAALLLLATVWLLSVLLRVQHQINPQREGPMLPPPSPHVMPTNNVLRKL